MALVKTQTGVTCPYSTSDSQFESARNGGAGYLITNGNTLERHRYLGLIPSSLGYSGASLIRNIRVTFQGRATINETDGTPIGSYDTISCRIMLGDKSTSNTLFSFSGYNISMTSATETGSYVGVTGKNYSTTWLNPSSAATITQTRDLLVSNAVLGVDVCARSTYKLAHKTYDWVNAVKFDYDLYIRNYVTFQGSGVTTTTTICDHGVVPSAPAAQVDTGKKFSGWRSSLDNKLYQTPPACTGLDVTYTAEYQDIDYHVGLLAVNTANTSLDVADNLSGSGAYQIGDTFTIAANTGDTYVADGSDNYKTYLFDYWTFQDANGNVLFDGDHFPNSALASLQVTAETIPSWWPAPAASGDHQGEYWIYGIAHYYQVFDLVFGDYGSQGYLDGLQKVSVTYTDLNDNTVTTNFARAATDTAEIFVRSVRSKSNTCQIRIYLNNTAAQPDEYCVGAIPHVTQLTYTALSDMSNPKPPGALGGLDLNYTLTLNPSFDPRLSGNWPHFGFTIYKNYYGININYTGAQTGDSTDGIVKIKNGNTVLTTTQAQHIARGSSITVDASASATEDTKYNVSQLTPPSDITVTNKQAQVSISRITKNNAVCTFTAALEVAYVTIQKSVSTDGGELVPSPAAQIERLSSYTFTQAAASGMTISSATLMMRGEQIQSWTNVKSISYTVARVTGDCVLTVYRAQNPQAYITMKVPTSSYGTVNVTGSTSVLKTEFTGFVISSITTRPTYDIESATYEWVEGSETVGTGTINPSVQTTLRYPKSTIPADKDVYVAITVQYRKNALYYSHKQSGETISRQPRSLWYTPVGQAPKQILAVYAQTATHPEPMLLFGPAPEEVEPEPPVERTKYKVLSLESQDLLDGATAIVRAVWTEDAGVCTPISFSTDFDSNLYEVYLDSITASMNSDNQRVYTMTIYDEGYGRDSYEFVCQQDSDGEWVYNNQRYNCNGDLLYGTGPASITTVYEDPTA